MYDSVCVFCICMLITNSKLFFICNIVSNWLQIGNPEMSGNLRNEW